MKHTHAQQKFYRRQVAVIRRHVPFDDDMRRDLIARVTGQRSTRDLSLEQMKSVIEMQETILRQCGVDLRSSTPAKLRRMTQLQYIDLLTRELGWASNPERLRGLMRKLSRGWHSNLNQLNSRQKTNLINALKQIKRDIRSGKARAERPQRPEPREPWKPEVIPGGIARGV